MGLKDIMGSAFKDNLTVEEIVAFFEGNNKIVNLSNGGYVSKEKFDDLNSKYQEIVNNTKDYDEVKGKYQELVEKQEKDGHLAIINKHVKPEFSEFAYYQLKQKELINEQLEENVKNYVKENAQYGIVKETPKQTRVINTFVNTNDGGDPNKSTNAYQAFNDAIREKASR